MLDIANWNILCLAMQMRALSILDYIHYVAIFHVRNKFFDTLSFSSHNINNHEKIHEHGN